MRSLTSRRLYKIAHQATPYSKEPTTRIVYRPLKGSILKIRNILSQGDAEGAHVPAQKCQQASEVEAPYTEVELSDPKFVHYMNDLLENYKVELEPVARRRLVLKNEARPSR
jgi:hypothetical protein